MAGGSDDAPDTVVEAPESETEITDESVNITIVSPPAVEPDAAPEPPAPVVEAHCEHCAEHAAEIAELRAAIAAMAVVDAAEEAAAEPVAEPPAPEPEPTQDIAPRREHPLHHKLFARSED